MFNRSGYFETNANWEEVKPPRQWSEKELMLFKLLPKNANWIAKDSDGYMTAFDIKPTKYHDKFIVADSNSEIEMFIDGFDFLTITFEESPIYIGDLKGE